MAEKRHEPPSNATKETLVSSRPSSADLEREKPKAQEVMPAGLSYEIDKIGTDDPLESEKKTTHNITLPPEASKSSAAPSFSPVASGASTPTSGSTSAKSSRTSGRRKRSSHAKWAHRIRHFLNAVSRDLNFFRLHIITFTLLPLVISPIFYAANGQVTIPYVDCLFMVYSAFTVTGLTSVNVSSLTGLQQAILYILMLAGDWTTAAWIMVLIRRFYFKRRCEELLESHRLVRTATLHYDLVERDSEEFERSVDEETLTPTGQSSSIPNPAASNDDTTRRRTSRQLHRQLTMHRETTGYQEAHESYTRAFPNEATGPAISFIDPARFRNHRGTLQSGFGGFDNPWMWLRPVIVKLFPRLSQRADALIRRNTVAQELDKESRPWLSFDGLKVGRNSLFNISELTDEQVEELGGIEYKALNLLSWLVPAYALCTQLVGFIMLSSFWACVSKYDKVFASQVKPIK